MASGNVLKTVYGTFNWDQEGQVVTYKPYAEDKVYNVIYLSTRKNTFDRVLKAIAKLIARDPRYRSEWESDLDRLFEWKTNA